MELKYIDIHSHLDQEDFDSDRDSIIEELRTQGVGTISVGTDLKESGNAVALAQKNEHMWATVGLHPTDNLEEALNIEAYRVLAQSARVVGIGECGLDYYKTSRNEASENQKERFLEQLELAVELKKPLMIHCRPTPRTQDAHEDMLALLTEAKKLYGEGLWGNIHFFTGTLDIARRYNALGFTVSFSGVITFAREYDEVIRGVPLEMMHAETDSPFAAPLPYRGKRNQPAYVREVVQSIARIRGEEEGTVAMALVANAKRVFRLA